MKIAFLGDIVLNEEINISKKIAEKINSCDYVLANLEGPIINNGEEYQHKKYGSLLCNNEIIIDSILKQINISHFSLYNNHMYDYGINGLDNTIKFCKKNNVNILKPFNIFEKNSEVVKLLNTGLPEYFGICGRSKEFGVNSNELIFSKNIESNIKDSIILGHFGIEMINSLSRYELAWFDRISSFSPKIIIRHHPHCIQNSFEINKVRCYPSIGDFSFSFGKKNKSSGLILIYDSRDNEVEQLKIKLEDGELSFMHHNLKEINLRLNESDKNLMRQRLIREYRDSGYFTLKKLIKKILGRENSQSSICISSTDFIQPFIIGEIFEENTYNPK